MIRELIVVEGAHDISAVRQAVDAELLITNGFALTEQIFARIERAQRSCGVIVFTDPDTAGEQIRRRIDERVPGCKHAHVPRAQALKAGDIGVENAHPEAILAALEGARATHMERRTEFTLADLRRHGLQGVAGARARRTALGAELNLGYCNARKLLSRLNHYGVTREEFERALVPGPEATQALAQGQTQL